MVDLLTQSKGDAITGGEITARVIIRPLIGAPQASRRAGGPATMPRSANGLAAI